MDIAVDNGFNLSFKPEGSFRGSAVSPPVVKCKFSKTGGSVYEIFLLVVFFAPFVLSFLPFVFVVCRLDTKKSNHLENKISKGKQGGS